MINSPTLPNESEAIFWYKKEAKQNDVASQNNLGMIFINKAGKERKAAKWFASAAELGSANATHNLAICYRFGKGVAPDLQKFILTVKAAKLGNRDAQNNFGMILSRTGKELEAVEWF